MEHECGKVISPTHRSPLPPPLRKYAWHSRLLEAESTPGPQCGRKDYNNEKLQRPKKLIVTITDMASRHRSVTVM